MELDIETYHYSNGDVVVGVNGIVFMLTREEADIVRWQLSTEYAEIQRNNEFPDEFD
jgi:hypothetical protein